MADTQAPTPGPLSAEGVKLLVKGDLLRIDTGGGLYRFLRTKTSPSRLVIAEPISGGLEGYYDRCRFAFIGRPDADGWMPWSGGENPVPEREVDVLLRDGELGEVDSANAPSDALQWSHDCDTPIVGFRLVPTAPVEASGSELKADFVRSHPSGMDDCTYEKIEDALDRADAPVTGPDGKFLTLAQRVDTLRPQPSGETLRLDRLHDWINREVPAGTESATWWVRQIDAALSTTPARAEALDEGAAGEEGRNLGWFAGLARKHGFHAQADWLDQYARARPSPTPAADADRVRIAAEALEPFEEWLKASGRESDDSCDGDVMSLDIDGPCLTYGHLRSAAEALAALKSDGK